MAITVLLASQGCGGSSGGSNSTPANPFAGDYEGAATLDGGKTGTLNLGIHEDGSVDGSLIVTAPPSAAIQAADGFPIGTYAVTGEATSAGVISITGMLPQDIPFTISGSLPSGASTGQLSIVLGEQSYNGTIHAQSDKPSGNVKMASIVTGNVRFGTWSEIALLQTTLDQGGHYKIFLTETIEMDSRSFDTCVPDDMDAGETINVTALSEGIRPIYSQFSWTDGKMYAWIAVSGSVTLVSRNGTKFSLVYNDVVFEPVEVGGNNAEGSFTADGPFHN